MAYSQIAPVAGQLQQGYASPVDTIQREILGIVITAVDNYYGAYHVAGRENLLPPYVARYSQIAKW